MISLERQARLQDNNWRWADWRNCNEDHELLAELPDDASLEDVQYHIYVRQEVQRGLDAAHDGKTVTQEELERRLGRWLEK